MIFVVFVIIFVIQKQIVLINYAHIVINNYNNRVAQFVEDKLIYFNDTYTIKYNYGINIF